MSSQNERPLVQTTALDNTKIYEANSKQFAGLRKDLNKVISLLRTLCEQVDKNNGGRLW